MNVRTERQTDRQTDRTNFTFMWGSLRLAPTNAKDAETYYLSEVTRIIGLYQEFIIYTERRVSNALLPIQNTLR